MRCERSHLLSPALVLGPRLGATGAGAAEAKRRDLTKSAKSVWTGPSSSETLTLMLVKSE